MLFLISLAVGLLATPFVAAVARRRGRVAAPEPDRWHVTPTALLGGVAIAIAYLATVLLVLPRELPTAWAGLPELEIAPTAGVVLAGAIMFVAGLVDDLLPLRAPTKLVVQTFGAAVLASSGVLFSVTPWMPVNVFVTLFWFIGLTNAMNLLDNMDGIAAGIAVIAALAFAVLFTIRGEVGLAGLSLGMAGATAAFLVFNFHPARIFMGDAGSMMLGATFAGLGAAATAPVAGGGTAAIYVWVVLLILAVPIFDTTLVTFTRTMARRPIAVGGRDHTAHRLVALGVSDRGAAIALYLLSAIAAALALLIAGFNTGVAGWTGILFTIGLMIFGAYLARTYAYPPQPSREMRLVSFLIDDLLYKRRLLEVAVDIVIFGAAYWGAFLLRWDGELPPEQRAALISTLGLAAVSKAIAFAAVGVYRGVWQQVSVADVHRLVRGALLGALLTAATGLFLFPTLPLSRSVFVLDAVLVLLMAFAVRLSFRSLDRVRYRMSGPKGAATLIYGAGRGGDLAVRELMANPQLGLVPVGFIDDDPRKAGLTLHGLPVHHGGNGLERVIRRLAVERILIGVRGLPPERFAEISDRCASAGVGVLELRIEIADAPGGHPPR